VAVACGDTLSARAWRRNRQRLLRRASSSTRSVTTVTELCIKGEAEVAWVPSAVTIGGVRSPIPVPGGQCDRTGAKEAGTEMHPEDELLKQEDFRTSWGIERLPPAGIARRLGGAGAFLLTGTYTMMTTGTLSARILLGADGFIDWL
jgi:hypothetical protein